MPSLPEEFVKPPEVPQEVFDYAKGLLEACEQLIGADLRPLHHFPTARPRLVWDQDGDDPTDEGGWIVETGFGVIHPYAYVDMVGPQDGLSQEIIRVTDYRNRTVKATEDILK